MLSIGLSKHRKEDLRAHWRQNETDYVRERRHKVDVSAFAKLEMQWSS
jgi:protein-serine/threonine kinase